MQPMSRMRSTGRGHHHQQQNKFLRIFTSPYRALCRARDLYVRSVTRCGQPPSFVPSKSKSRSNLPRSFSAASSSISTLDDHNNEDYRELVRAASVRTLRESNIIEAETMMTTEPRSVRRSASVGIGMGRIDEEAPFEVEGVEGGNETWQSGFGVTVRKKKKMMRGDLLYPRSKSYAVVNNLNVAF